MSKEKRSSSGPWGERLREGGKGDRSLTGSPMVPMRTIHEKEPQRNRVHPWDGVGKKGDGRGKNKVFRGTDSFEGCRLTVKVRQKRTGQAVVDVELEGAVEGEGGRERRKKGKKSDRRNRDGRKSREREREKRERNEAENSRRSKRKRKRKRRETEERVMTEQPYRLLVQAIRVGKAPSIGDEGRLQLRLFASQILSWTRNRPDPGTFTSGAASAQPVWAMNG
ncbi:uncharacterized protein An18g06040 [Aspergillus niger]|uniref:Contig An18c0190, genomic contig n=2 Tax=Aspergillus niger TaxID=5061 RepID=A2RBA3_ASPNC|nr:uncharacterized protein An18g06040 [Aspergillus niger]CAK43327.1 unnamed protein product [Aspergillus niger]